MILLASSVGLLALALAPAGLSGPGGAGYHFDRGLFSVGRVSGPVSVTPQDPALPPLPIGPPAEVKLEFQWIASRTCDGTYTGDHHLVASGDISGADGTWQYLDTTYRGDGLQGFAASPASGHGAIATEASIDGVNEAGTLVLDYGGSGIAVITAAVRLIDCANGATYRITSDDLSDTCSVRSEFFWAETSGPGSGPPRLYVWDSPPGGTKHTIHRSHVYDCPGPADGDAWNPSVAQYPR